MARREAVVRAEGLAAGYGRRLVLEDVSLEVGAGEVVALLGRNGSGKTTLIRCLLGQLPPRAGSLTVAGEDPWRRRVRAMARVGYVPERCLLPGEVRLRSVVRLAAALHPGWDAVAAAERLERFGIGGSRRVRDLSRGQLAQLQLVLALSARPKVLLLDDPALGLDAVARRELYGELIRELADRGAGVLLATHDLDGVERLAHRVAVLAGGRIALEGEVESVRREWSGRLGREASLEDVFVAVAGGAA